MPTPNLHLLTYLAQVRQLRFKNVLLNNRRVFTMPHFLHIKPSKKHGTSHKAIVIIGIVLVAGWDARNKNTGAWLKVAGYWR